MSKKEFIVKGSNNNSYKVINDNGIFSCECKSFLYRRQCKHIENIKLNMSDRRNVNLNQSFRLQTIF